MVRDFGECPACGVSFKPGRVPGGLPPTCPACGQTLRLSSGVAWGGALLAAACSVLFSVAWGFRGMKLCVVSWGLWFPIQALVMFALGYIRPPRYKRLSETDRFEPWVGLFGKRGGPGTK